MSRLICKVFFSGQVLGILIYGNDSNLAGVQVKKLIQCLFDEIDKIISAVKEIIYFKLFYLFTWI